MLKNNDISNLSKAIGSLVLLASIIVLIFSPLTKAHPQHKSNQFEQTGEQPFEHRSFEQRGNKMRHRGPMHRLQHALAKLDLSDEQKQSIESIKQANQQAMESAHDSILPLKQQVHKLMNEETLDSAQIKELSRQIAEKKADQLILMASIKKQILALLTADQQAELDRMKERRQQWKQSRLMD